MKLINRFHIIPLLLCIVLFSCSKSEHKVVIGVSQCSGGFWREKLNNEMRRELLLNDGIEMELLCAEDNIEQQKSDIQRLIDQKVDILIVSPLTENDLVPVIAEAYDSGIPVVLFDRTIKSNKYTAFVGGDNKGVGEIIGNFASNHLPHGGNVVEIMGNMHTSPARLRHQGIVEALKSRSDINMLASVDVGWVAPRAREVMDSLMHIYDNIDVVVAHTDFMASAAKAVADSINPANNIKYIGADGFGSPGLGIYAVENGTIDATAVYPTGGDIIIQTAIDILDGKKVDRQRLIPSHLVSEPKDANLLVTLNDALDHEVNTIQRLRSRIMFYMDELVLERTVLVATIAVLLLVILLLITYIRMRTKVKRHEQKITEQKEELHQKEEVIHKKEEEIQEKDVAIHEKDEVIQTQEEEISDIKERLEIFSEFDREFMDKLNKVVEEHLADEDFSVEALASDMCLSRAHMYRRCKALTGVTPVELIRNTRMDRARQMFRSGNTSVSAVAQQVGIPDASYFTRCYKGYFGVVPKKDINTDEQ